MNYPILIDCWEGSLDIQEDVLLKAGLSGLIVRMNDINGGHHLDTNFKAQWEQAKPFPVRFPYFVYNPWVSGPVNYQFLMDNLPADAPKRIAVDIEVVRQGYSPAAYAAEVDGFINLLAKSCWPVIYTGGWFIPNLASWPHTAYWWARYPLSLYPNQSQAITWEALKKLLNATLWLPGCTLGTCKLWQCTADRYKPPGCCDRAVDINIWNGTQDELRAWVGDAAAPVLLTWGQKVALALLKLGEDVGPPPEGV